MKQLFLAVLLLFSVASVYCQRAPLARSMPATLETKKLLDSERVENFYANRKYTFGISETLYGNLNKYHPFGVFDITFSDRLTWMDMFNNASLETTIGIGFQPYQGTRLHIGGDYELLSKRLNFNLYVGAQYALGLAQATTMGDNSNIYVGYHNYLTPFVGFMFWPHKKDILDENGENNEENTDPRFWELFYFKFQVSYNFLISSVQIDTSGHFDPNLYGIIKRNVLNTVGVKIGLGINIPTLGRKRAEYNRFRARMREQGAF